MGERESSAYLLTAYSHLTAYLRMHIRSATSNGPKITVAEVPAAVHPAMAPTALSQRHPTLHQKIPIGCSASHAPSLLQGPPHRPPKFLFVVPLSCPNLVASTRHCVIQTCPGLQMPSFTSPPISTEIRLLLSQGSTADLMQAHRAAAICSLSPGPFSASVIFHAVSDG